MVRKHLPGYEATVGGSSPSCSLSGTAKTICQARVTQYCCSDPVGNAFHESNGRWMTNSISSCVGLARKRRKPRKARKGNESAEANTRSAEARGSTRKRQMISSQFGLLILITAQVDKALNAMLFELADGNLESKPLGCGGICCNGCKLASVEGGDCSKPSIFLFVCFFLGGPPESIS